jgi:hypothetical protein
MENKRGWFQHSPTARVAIFILLNNSHHYTLNEECTILLSRIVLCFFFPIKKDNIFFFFSKIVNSWPIKFGGEINKFAEASPSFGNRSPNLFII